MPTITVISNEGEGGNFEVKNPYYLTKTDQARIFALLECKQFTIKAGGPEVQYSADKLPRRARTANRNRSIKTFESIALANGKKGDIFYTEKLQKHLTAIAVFHKRKIQTERIVAIKAGGTEPEAKYITRITILA